VRLRQLAVRGPKRNGNIGKEGGTAGGTGKRAAKAAERTATSRPELKQIVAKR
jgi:hypothetical protein